MERAAADDTLRFWWRLIETTASLFWRVLAADPWSLTGLVFRGLLVNISLWVLAWFVIGQVWMLTVLATGLFGKFAAPGTSDSGTGAICAFLSFLVVVAPIQFVTARWIARRARGREIPACARFGAMVEDIALAIRYNLIVLSGGITGSLSADNKVHTSWNVPIYP